LIDFYRNYSKKFSPELLLVEGYITVIAAKGGQELDNIRHDDRNVQIVAFFIS